jgi:fermentation-respiration switch protein FrsA (DUF1100 family)
MKLKLTAILLLIFVLGGILVTLSVGSSLMAPAQQHIDPPSNVQNLQSVQFTSESGSTIHGWLMPGIPDKGVVVLMHGVRANRLSMLRRAQFLNQNGYTVLLFDFQAHGESEGKHITFGYLESRDAIAGVNFVRLKFPGKKIGVIGVSMGGAAASLASPPLPVEAIVFEMVYPSIDRAVDNRLTMRLGNWSKILSPLLLLQLKWRLGIDPKDLRPIERVTEIRVPKLFIAGSEDRHTTLEESREFYNAAADPKELWIVDGAAHLDLHEFNKEAYESRVLGFFNEHLR